MPSADQRLDRIEQKIDKLSEAMISLARAEEKLMAIESDRQNVVERLNRHSEKIDELNDLVKENTRTINNISKFFWLVLAVFATAAAGALFM
jgi:ABC-type transporter Mla subunit MlaD